MIEWANILSSYSIGIISLLCMFLLCKKFLKKKTISNFFELNTLLCFGIGWILIATNNYMSHFGIEFYNNLLVKLGLVFVSLTPISQFMLSITIFFEKHLKKAIVLFTIFFTFSLYSLLSYDVQYINNDFAFHPIQDLNMIIISFLTVFSSGLFLIYSRITKVKIFSKKLVCIGSGVIVSVFASLLAGIINNVIISIIMRLLTIVGVLVFYSGSKMRT